MHYMTRRSHQLQKHKFGVKYPGALFMETRLGPPEHEKYCIDISHPGRTRMHYVTCTSHRMKKHNFGITCPGALFVESLPVPHEHDR
jgi:hypothetical protein